MKSKLFLIIIFGIFCQSASAEWTTQSFFDFLKKKYGNINTVSMDFWNTDITNLKGSLVAKKGGFYKIDFNYRQMLSDGQYIYNYSKRNNKIVKSKSGAIPDNFSLESVMFSFTNDYNPSQLETLKNKSGGIEYVLTLLPKDEKYKKLGITSIQLWFDLDKIILTGVTIMGGSHYQHWLINNLKINPELPANSFTFLQPKGVELIDLTE